MKETTASTLSAHLLREAARFLVYPELQHRTRATVEAQQLVDEGLRMLVDWRTTFNPTTIGKLDLKPELLNDLYCRELLRTVPEMVERTLGLATLTLKAFQTKSASSISRRPRSATYMVCPRHQ